MVVFGQVVVGAPGAGKTTYCAGMQQLMAGIERPCVVVRARGGESLQRAWILAWSVLLERASKVLFKY